MFKIKTLFQYIPEMYLLGVTLYYWIMTGSLLNPVAIVLLLALLLQMWFNSANAGLVLAIVWLLLSLYLVLALISEISAFTQRSTARTELLLFGTLFIGGNLLMGSLMLLKYLKTKVVVVS